MLLYILNEDIHEEFLFWLWERLIKLEEADKVPHKSMQFVEDVKCYLWGEDNFKILQPILGFKIMFREFVIKDWFDSDENYNKFYNQNMIIAQE